MKLLKFISYSHYLLEGLTNQTLFFSNSYDLNDPFEGIFRYKVSSDYGKFKDFYLNHYGGHPEKLKYYFNNKLAFEDLINKTFKWRYENNGVCCFSHASRIKDILMWATYADKHKGLCLVFDKEQLKFTPTEKIVNGTLFVDPTGPHKVSYSGEYLDADPLSKNLNQKTFLATKFNKWSNEKEFRFISPKEGNYRFNPESLVEIIFGLRIATESKETIKSIVTLRYGKVKFRRIKLSNKRFAFELTDE